MHFDADRALHYAAEYGHVNVVTAVAELCEEGLCVDAKDNSGWFALVFVSLLLGLFVAHNYFPSSLSGRL
jgi:hypothetical protein